MNTTSLSLAVLATLVLSGCLIVGTTEHTIRVQQNGSGEALLRLVDIRSDGATDSLVAADFEELVRMRDAEFVPEFEREGRLISAKQLYVAGDTLIADVTYTFNSLTAIEALSVRPEEVLLFVSAEREIVETNGTVADRPGGGWTITWPRSERRMHYVIRERPPIPGVSLAPLYGRSAGQ
jgi:hypothetical protein